MEGQLLDLLHEILVLLDAVGLIEVENGSHVIKQDDIDVQPGSDQPTGLEKIFVVVHGLLGKFWIIFLGISELTSLVNSGQVVNDRIVETVEENQQSSNSGRERKKTRFGEAVGLDLAVLHRSHLPLFIDIATVKRRQVQIRTGLRIGEVLMIRAEQVMDDD